MQHYLTPAGFQKLKEQLEYLKTVARKEVVERIAAAKELGDLKENAEYAEAKEDQGMIEAKIVEIELAVKNAVIIDEEKTASPNKRVTIGSTVVVQCNGASCTYMIVGTEEADPEQSKISYESPLGRAFINKRAGDTAIVTAPKGEFTYQIIEVK